MIIDAIAPPKQLLYFSPVAWDSYAQRPHYVARHFLDRGGAAVLWVDPYPNRLPRLADLRRRTNGRARAEPDPRVSVIRVPSWPVEPLPGGPALNRALRWPGLLASLAREMGDGQGIIGVGRPSALAVIALQRLRARARFYDAMDDFPEFYGGLSRRSMRRQEDAVLGAVDRVYAASDALMEKFARRGVAASLVANAYAMRTLPPFQPRPPSAAPVFGYVGTVGQWFDWNLVGRLAAAFPAAEVRIVGPVFSGPPRGLPGNVRFAGECPQAAAVEHLRDFACGLIPFRKTPLTAAVDPIKYYEYRGMGLPVLATRFGQMAARGRTDGVFVVDGDDGLEAVARAALAHMTDAAAVARFRAENDWDTRLGRAALFPELGALPV
jgi:hypothetical protein